ncbi:energy transducer TonB [Marinobacterium sediminicola]|uniref:Protein TonB n=1 Tax=Marinobacterium sediminicola TaxID=518898 RepID=A0ABY1S1Z7_9GAMM|nr:energy transducer TonB [Marinobacterium sediminicola]ULG69372.1 energy transducer TonB [Marinobacterium sediminicola]SMR75519.1 protein TonB [Marinobacterium sediminicola]
MSTMDDHLPLWHHLNRDSFGFMLFMATLAHGVLLLALSFTLPEVEPPQQTLDVTLAQYPQKEEPEKADFIAQHNQRGSGSADQAATPSTTEIAPLASTESRLQAAQQPPAPEPAKPTPVTEPSAGQESERQGQDSRAQRPQISRQTEDATQNTQAKPDKQAAVPAAQPSSSTSLMARSLEMASLQAKLDLIREERAKKPRVLRLTSAATRAHKYAAYLDNWRRRVETVGNLNYPEQARRQGLQGTLRLLVALNPDGQVVNIEILSSSGYRILDDAAIRIVQQASPFQSFPVEMRKHVDRLEIIRTWKFEKQARVY